MFNDLKLFLILVLQSERVIKYLDLDVLCEHDDDEAVLLQLAALYWTLQKRQK